MIYFTSSRATLDASRVTNRKSIFEPRVGGGERQVEAPRRTQAGHVTGIIAVGVTRTHQLHRFLHPGIHGQTSLNYISHNFLFARETVSRVLPRSPTSDYRSSKNSQRVEKGRKNGIVSAQSSFVHARSLSFCFRSLLSSVSF